MILQDYLLPDDIQRHEVEFTGSGKEYFRVWIVNVVLSVLTLGPALGSPFAWLALVAMSVAGATIRLWFVMRHRGQSRPALVAVGNSVLQTTIDFRPTIFTAGLSYAF